MNNLTRMWPVNGSSFSLAGKSTVNDQKMGDITAMTFFGSDSTTKPRELLWKRFANLPTTSVQSCHPEMFRFMFRSTNPACRRNPEKREIPLFVAQSRIPQHSEIKEREIPLVSGIQKANISGRQHKTVKFALTLWCFRVVDCRPNPEANAWERLAASPPSRQTLRGVGR